jgi:hypothetical protein
LNKRIGVLQTRKRVNLMARQRQKDFRSGDLCEAMGILLLKGIAAVAEVGRTEDVAIDAVATLLRAGPEEMLVAEDTFFVQIKSSSKRRIDYDRHEVDWLRELRLPFFIASVDKQSSTLSLYTTNRLAGFLISSKDPDKYRLQLHKKNTRNSWKLTEIYVGPPIATWTVSQLSDAAHLDRVYRVIKAHIAVEQRNIAYRSIKYFQGCFWTTNDENLKLVLEGGRGPRGQEIKPILSSISPHLALMTSYCHESHDLLGIEALQALTAWMKSEGVDTALEKPLRHMREDAKL